MARKWAGRNPRCPPPQDISEPEVQAFLGDKASCGTSWRGHKPGTSLYISRAAPTHPITPAITPVGCTQGDILGNVSGRIIINSNYYSSTSCHMPRL